MAYRAHLDYASTAPIRPNSRNEMAKSLELDPFDPRRLYDDAIDARYAIEDARQKIANCFGCDPFEIIFTSSHSEALATFAYGCLNDNSSKEVIGTVYDSEVLTKTWQANGATEKLIPGNSNALLELNAISEMVNSSTVGATIPFAHPDTGTIQDVETFTQNIREINTKCLIHVDARLAAGNTEINFSQLGVDAMSIDPATFGGPLGVSALILSRNSHLKYLLPGATQERARRAGLENYVGIIGFGAASAELKTNIKTEIERYRKLKSTVKEIFRTVGVAQLDCDSEVDASLPNIAAGYFKGVAASAVVAELNRKAINIHAGSSCGSEEFEPSTQLRPVTNDDTISESVFRISWGFKTTNEEIELLQTAMSELPFSS